MWALRAPLQLCMNVCVCVFWTSVQDVSWMFTRSTVSIFPISVKRREFTVHIKQLNTFSCFTGQLWLINNETNQHSDISHLLCCHLGLSWLARMDCSQLSCVVLQHYLLVDVYCTILWYVVLSSFYGALLTSGQWQYMKISLLGSHCPCKIN